MIIEGRFCCTDLFSLVVKLWLGEEGLSGSDFVVLMDRCEVLRIGSSGILGIVLFAGGAGADLIRELKVLLCDISESLRFGSSPSLSEGKEATELIVRIERAEKVGDAGVFVPDGSWPLCCAVITLFRMDDGTCGTDDASPQRFCFRGGTGGAARFSFEGGYRPFDSGNSSFMLFCAMFCRVTRFNKSILGGGTISISGFFRRHAPCCFSCSPFLSFTSIDFNLFGVRVTFIVPPDNMSASKSIILLSSSSIVGDGEVALPIISLSMSLL
jgi:hypothetical protein